MAMVDVVVAAVYRKTRCPSRLA